MRFFRTKLLHFFLIGLALYILDNTYTQYEQRQLVCPTQDEIEAMAIVWAQQNRQVITDDVRQVLAQSALDDEMLIREAQLSGLYKRDKVVLQRLLRDAEFLGITGDRSTQIDTVMTMGLLDSDEVIRRRLIQLQKHQATAEVSMQNPNKSELLHLAEKFPHLGQRPSRFSFEQRFFSGDTLEQKQRAERLKVRLNLGEAPTSSDVFLGGESFTEMSAKEINRVFGPAFWLNTIDDASLDRWMGPLKSVYGWHLINVHDIVPGSVRPFEELRPELELIWRQDLQQRSWQAYIAKLRGQYRVLCRDEA
jgi:hypothetical protein